MTSLDYDGITYSAHNPYPDLSHEYRNLFEKVFSYPEYFDFFTSISREDGYVISAHDNDNYLAGMAFLLPCMLKNKDNFAMGYYLYSVCVDQNYRRRGIFKKICEYAESTALSLSGKFIVLIPADEHLFQTYTRFGYTSKLPGRVPIGADYDVHTTEEAQKFLKGEIATSAHAPAFIFPVSIQQFARKNATLYKDNPVFDKGLLKIIDKNVVSDPIFDLLPFADNFPE